MTCPADPNKWSLELATIVAENPNFCIQVSEWKAGRKAAGEDPNDWEAFRAHLVAIGAPDPGPMPYPEWTKAPFDVKWLLIIGGVGLVAYSMMKKK